MEASENIHIYTEIGAAWVDKHLESIYISHISEICSRNEMGRLVGIKLLESIEFYDCFQN